MRRTTGWLLAGVLVAGALGAPAQQDFSKVEVKAEKVKGNVYMLTGAGGNIGVSAGPDGVLIVDDQFAPLADKIRAALAGISSGKLKFILNTHFHGDHTGGNKEFGPEAPIIAQTNVRKRLMTDQTRGGRTTPAAPKEAWPVVTFDHSVSIHFNGEEIKAIHFPQGHTDGDSVIFFTGSNVVHMGDDFFAGRFPFVDLDAGGNVDGLIKNIAELISQIPADAAIIPGHGPVSTVEDLKAYHQMLVETSAIVANKMKAGKSLDAIRAEGLGDQWASWGTGFINTRAWIEAIYKSKSF
jgi:glyoxylase-like metal-dependent hydrolase (beta-lactamase superfamily II)